MVERSLQPREYALVPVVIALGALLVYDLPFVGLPLSAMVLGRLVFAGSDLLVYVAIALAGAASSILGVARPLMVVPSLGALVWAARAITRRDAWRVFAVLVVVSFGAYVMAFAVGAVLQGDTPLQAVTVQVDQAVEQMDALFAGEGSDPVVRSTYDEVRETVRATMLAVWPGLHLVGAMLAAAVSLTWLSRLSIAHGILPRGPRPLVAFDASWHVVWPLIAGLAITAWALYLDAESTLLAAVGFNALLVAGTIVCVQGLAVAEALMRRFRVGILLRLLAYGALFWTNLIVPLFAVVGTADLWLNLRKIPRGVRPPADATETDSDGGVE